MKAAGSLHKEHNLLRVQLAAEHLITEQPITKQGMTKQGMTKQRRLTLEKKKTPVDAQILP